MRILGAKRIGLQTGGQKIRPPRRECVSAISSAGLCHVPLAVRGSYTNVPITWKGRDRPGGFRGAPTEIDRGPDMAVDCRLLTLGGGKWHVGRFCADGGGFGRVPSDVLRGDGLRHRVPDRAARFSPRWGALTPTCP